MQSVRATTKLPRAHRIIKAVAPLEQTRNMAFFPRFPAGEFTPLFRMLDDYASHTASRDHPNHGSSFSLRSFQPRFDVKELKEAYELNGELPGIDQKDINIEFTDASTIHISGRTEHISEHDTPSQALQAGQQTAQIEDTSNTHKATVEDAPEEQTGSTAEKQVSEHEGEQQPSAEQAKYWVSERSVGKFSRTFTFPSRVDQEAVKASLKNGILSIVVPKANAPTTRRINIE